ncbi:MAG TPA: SRPBCC domain-containing protein, partial [Rugosimonospora sp.]|nr:SRPBCC domain-containing protein [Rugosimonospora sp.]
MPTGSLLPAGMPTAPTFDLTAADASFQPLGGRAFPAVQDRWERLVSMATIPEPADRVWSALVQAEHIREWLGVVHGGWATRGRESTLDFEDGEFFYCRTEQSTPPAAARPGTLRYLWRWVGIGPATSVTWTLTPAPVGTLVTVLEEATNPPSDWRSWNGMGWPGILDQLANYLRTGVTSRWPWRRMGPYLQIPLPAMPFEAWDRLTHPSAVKHWLQRSAGSLAVGDPMTVVMGDASGTVQLTVTRSVDTAQEFPSYLPYLEFELRRPSWDAALGGRLWIEPAGLGQSILQVFHFDWERLDIRDPVTERRLLTGFWAGAAGRAQMLFAPQGAPAGPHGWTSGGAPPPANGAAAGNGHQPAADPLATVDFPAAMAFAGKVLGDLGATMTSLLAVLGVRLGLFGALAAGPAGSAELADRTGLSERYVREWLWGLHSAGYLRLDPATRTFSLPAEHAAVLAYPQSPLSLAAAYDLVPPLASMVDEVATAFRSGQGISPDRYPSGLFSAMERMSATWLDANLVGEWLPAVDGLVNRLRNGAKVADVGSGGGRALISMAKAFPDSEFTGYDRYKPNVARAEAAARAAGVADRVTFHDTDATDRLAGPL